MSEDDTEGKGYEAVVNIGGGLRAPLSSCRIYHVTETVTAEGDMETVLNIYTPSGLVCITDEVEKVLQLLDEVNNCVIEEF